MNTSTTSRIRAFRKLTPSTGREHVNQGREIKVYFGISVMDYDGCAYAIRGITSRSIGVLFVCVYTVTETLITE